MKTVKRGIEVTSAGGQFGVRGVFRFSLLRMGFALGVFATEGRGAEGAAPKAPRPHQKTRSPQIPAKNET